MKVVFLGTGEAFDEHLPNNSQLIIGKKVLLLDCGYAIPHALWKYNANPSFIDAIYITHAHADHYFGLPMIILRMMEEGRKKDLTLFCQKGMKEMIQHVLSLAYRTLQNVSFLKIIEVDEGQQVKYNELLFTFAYSTHSTKNLAIRISAKNKVVCYSGDGMFTERSEHLYKNADLVIHESFKIDEELHGHATIKKVIEMAKKNNVKCLALTHIQRKTRWKETKQILKLMKSAQTKIIMPKPLDEMRF